MGLPEGRAHATADTSEQPHRRVASASLEPTGAPAKCRRMKNIEALIADGGDITLGAVYPIECAATAADGHNSVAMLVRRKGETLNALLKRLDKAIAKFYDDEETIDEINSI